MRLMSKIEGKVVYYLIAVRTVVNVVKFWVNEESWVASNGVDEPFLRQEITAAVPSRINVDLCR